MVKFRELLKLPEGEVEFEDFIKIPLFLLSVTQFRFKPLDEQATWKKKLKYYARLVYVAFTILCYALGMVMILTLAFISLDDFALASSCILNSASIVLIATKMLVPVFGKSTLRRIIEELGDLSKQRQLLKPSSKRVYRVKEYLKRFNLDIKAYLWIDVIMFGPIVFPVVSFILNGTMKQSVSYWFPFDPYQPHTFPFVLVWIDYIGWNCLVHMSSVDLLLYGLITAIEVEFNVLQVDWLAFKYNAKHERPKQIKNMVDRHNKLLDMVDKLQSVYSFSFLVSFVITSLILCFIAFQMSIAQDLDTTIFYAAYFLLLLGQVWFLCLYGQKLINSSEAVANAVYHCEWEDIRDNALKKQLLLVILRAQKPAKLSAMDFADISFPTFTSVI